MNTIDLVLNGSIFLITLVLLLRFPWENGRFVPERLRKALRFFTCQSNLLCGAACLLTVIFGIIGNGQIPEKVWLLKYVGTAAVTVTMATVFLFLAPSVGKGWAKRLLGTPHDFCMHLVTPVFALVSFCVFEKRGMTFGEAMLGQLPVMLYGIQYIYKIKFAPAEKRWEDFYGFDRNGRLLLSVAGMLAGTFVICLGLMALQNL